MPIPKKVEERIRAALKQFSPVLNTQRDRDVSEADTVTIVKDLMADLFAFDKYSELTSEHQIRGTYCDLAVRIDGKLSLLLEVKSIGLTLNDRHVKQAVDYAANQGLDHVVLTNGIQWRLYKLQFKKPIEHCLVTDFDLLQLNPKSDDDLERIYLLTREGLMKGAIKDFTARKDATSRYLLSSLLLHDDDILAVIRRELRKVTDMLVPVETIAQVLRTEVIKREALEGPAAIDATRLVQRRTRVVSPTPLSKPQLVASRSTASTSTAESVGSEPPPLPPCGVDGAEPQVGPCSA